MPAGLRNLLGPRAAQTVDPTAVAAVKSVAALLRRRTAAGRARLAARLLAGRGFGLVAAGTAVPDAADFELWLSDVGGYVGEERLLREALTKRSGPLASLASARPCWVALDDDQFQIGAAFLRRFNLTWYLLLPWPGSAGTASVAFLLVGGAGRQRPDDPILALLREAWSLLATAVCAGTASPFATVGAAIGRQVWRSAPSALALVAGDEIVAANAAAERLLRESVGRGDGAWPLWLAASTRRLMAAGRASEILPATANRDRSLEIRLGEPVEPSGARVVALRDATAEVAADSRQAETISTLSHELRTPLTALKNGVRLVLGGDAGPLTEQQQRLLGLADRNSDRLERLITDLLDAARADAGRLRLNRRPLDLAPLLREALEGFTLTVRERGLTVDDSGLPDTFVAHVDGDKIVQVVHNVVGNALKYTDPGGFVRVWLQERGASVPPEAVWLADQFFLPLRTFALVVEDNGPGMTPALQERVFEPFSRGDETATAAVPGAGLGLHISKSLVEMHGGSIRMTSQAGIGTTVWIVLPRDPDSERVLAVCRVVTTAAAGGAAENPQLAALDLRRPDTSFTPDEMAAAGRAVRRFLFSRSAPVPGGEHTAVTGGPASRLACCEELAAGLWVGLVDGANGADGLAEAWSATIRGPGCPAPLAHSRWSATRWPTAGRTETVAAATIDRSRSSCGLPNP